VSECFVCLRRTRSTSWCGRTAWPLRWLWMCSFRRCLCRRRFCGSQRLLALLLLWVLLLCGKGTTRGADKPYRHTLTLTHLQIREIIHTRTLLHSNSLFVHLCCLLRSFVCIFHSLAFVFSYTHSHN